MNQRTIAKEVEIVGIGLHKGTPVKLKLEPLEANCGIIFQRNDTLIPLKPDNVVDTKLATVIGNKGEIISTIEHFLSSVYAFGIDNLKVIVDADEMPVLDGSSIGFCMLLKEAGIRELDEPKKLLVIKKEVEVRDGDKFAKISPSSNLEFNFGIEFEHKLISKQNFSFNLSSDSFLDEIARARTFGFLRDVEYLRSIGLAKGGSLDNAIVLDDRKVLNPDGLRFENEFVRHKILDAMGDLALLGALVVGKYEAFASSHHLNHLLTKEVLSDEKNYEIVTQESSYSYARS